MSQGEGASDCGLADTGYSGLADTGYREHCRRPARGMIAWRQGRLQTPLTAAPGKDEPDDRSGEHA
jgi:hypothetical protein